MLLQNSTACVPHQLGGLTRDFSKCGGRTYTEKLSPLLIPSSSPRREESAGVNDILAQERISYQTSLYQGQPRLSDWDHDINSPRARLFDPVHDGWFTGNRMECRTRLGHQELPGRIDRSYKNSWGSHDGLGSPYVGFRLPYALHQECYSDIDSNCSSISEPISLRVEDNHASVQGQCKDLQNHTNETEGSYLFVTFNHRVSNPEKVLERILLKEHNLSIEEVRRCGDSNVFSVLFDKHASAKRAFTFQRKIGLRMEPPKFSKRNWFRNPAPNFHVKFETRRRLTVKKGKSTSAKNVGELLMTDAKNRKGCEIWTDQLKGNRLRIVGFVGRLLLTNGQIIENDQPPSATEKKIVGWISIRSKVTKAEFVDRKSGNSIEEYLYSN